MNDYEILGIKPGATKKQIMDAYKKQAKIWHPDANRENSEIATKKIQEINRAYQNLIKSNLSPEEQLRLEQFKIDEKTIKERKKLLKTEETFNPLSESFKKLKRKKNNFRLEIETSLQKLMTEINRYYSNQIYDLNQSRFQKLQENKKKKLKEQQLRINEYLMNLLQEIQNAFFAGEDEKVFSINITESIITQLNKLVSSSFKDFLNVVEKYHKEYPALIIELEKYQIKLTELELQIEQAKQNLEYLNAQRLELIKETSTVEFEDSTNKKVG